MDFAELLQSPSIRDQSVAAMFLRSQGAEGTVRLPHLLAACRSAQRATELDRFQEALLSFGSLSICEILGDIGFDADNPLHAELVELVMRLTNSSNIQVAATAIHALGLLKHPLDSVLDCLLKLIASPVREGEHPEVGLGAVAVRSLRRLDAPLAALSVGAQAFEDYERALRYWIKEGHGGNATHLAEFQAELDWVVSSAHRDWL